MCIRDRSLNSPQHDRERDAARQRAAATRMRETDEARQKGVYGMSLPAVSAVVHTWCGGEMNILGAAAKRVRVNEYAY